MANKLTLSIEKEVVESAKNYAQETGRSLSELVENYFKALTQKEIQSKPLSPRIKRLRGSVKLPDDFDYKKSIESEITNKHS